MILTLEKLFNSPLIIKAVIDRVMQTTLDTIVWKRYLDFEETKSRLFKTYLGTVTGVVMGSKGAISNNLIPNSPPCSKSLTHCKTHLQSSKKVVPPKL